MVIVVGLEKLKSLSAKKKFGRPNHYGRSTYGFSPYGLDLPEAGIYQRKRTRKGWQTSRMKFYRPTNPQTPKQQAGRAKFAAGVTEWHNLTEGARQAYNQSAKAYRITGYNLFLREWLKS